MTMQPPDDSGARSPEPADGSAPRADPTAPAHSEEPKDERAANESGESESTAASDNSGGWTAPGPPTPENVSDAENTGDEAPRGDEQAIPIPIPPRAGAPAGSAYGYPARYAEAPGSGRFQLALPQLGTIVSGPAVGSMVAGIGALLVSIALGCAGFLTSVILTIAVTLLAVFCAAAAGVLGAVALRQVKRGEGEYRGKGMAVAGLICAGVALLLTVLFLTLSLVLRI